MIGNQSRRSRAQRLRINREIIVRKRAALIEAIGGDDIELRQRLEHMSYAEIVAHKNAGNFDAPPLPGVDE